MRASTLVSPTLPLQILLITLDYDAVGETASAASASGGDEGEGPEIAMLNAVGDNGANHEAVLSAVALETDLVCS